MIDIAGIKARLNCVKKGVESGHYGDEIKEQVRDIEALLASLEFKPASEPPPLYKPVLAQDSDGQFGVVYLYQDGTWRESTSDNRWFLEIVRWWDILEVLEQ